MLQRLGIAATLVARPTLILLDEPASALDPQGRREVLDLITTLRGHATVLFSSHILGDVQEVCDTVGILHHGQLLFQGPLSELLVGRAVPRYVLRVRDGGRRGRGGPLSRGVGARPPPRQKEASCTSKSDRSPTPNAASLGSLAAAGASVVSLRPRRSIPRARLPGVDLMSPWRLEILRLTRTKKWVALVGVYVGFGLLGPLTARYIKEILSRVGSSDGTVITVPDPTPVRRPGPVRVERRADRHARRRDRGRWRARLRRDPRDGRVPAYPGEPRVEDPGAATRRVIPRRRRRLPAWHGGGLVRDVGAHRRARSRRRCWRGRRWASSSSAFVVALTAAVAQRMQFRTGHGHDVARGADRDAAPGPRPRDQLAGSPPRSPTRSPTSPREAR